MNGAPRREWVLHSPDPGTVRDLSARHDLSPPAARTLVNRGIVEPADVLRFLGGTLSDLADPAGLEDAARAARRLAAAGARGEPVLVYADYDADGATGAACLYLFLKELYPDLPVRIHQNDRRRDGYGVQARILADSARDGFRLVVTVDCGITDVAAIREAGKNGVEVIVTDHHLPGESLPGAFAVVNPRRRDASYPEKEMAGVGVAFALVCALRKEIREAGGFAGRAEPPLRPYLDLVALGTVADMAPLRGANRILVREGLREIRKAPRTGIAALFAAAGVAPGEATETDLGFRVGPRLNAAGRIGDATRSSRLLVSASPEEAGRLARELNEDNALRQREEERIIAAVEAALASEAEIPPAIVLSDPAWNAGVLGIVASKVLERFGRPVVLLQEEDGAAKGSCRSAEGFHMVSELARLSHLLTRFGGHAQAAGLALPLEHLDAFRREFSSIAEDHARKTPFVLRQEIDAPLRVGEITPDLASDLSRLRPFGAGNGEPVFLLRNVAVGSASRIGPGGRHLRFLVEEDGRRIPGVAFRRRDIPSNGAGRSDLLCTVQENVYRGSRTLQILLRDARPAGEPVLCAGTPAG
ncbi:MAG: single-stranded-DNA-specific exonuclease RecJ [Deltaproteobacteria bacterium]